MTPALLFIIGASGSGKTAAVRALEARALPRVGCCYFDSTGVAPAEVMKRDFGGPELWQADATDRWVDRLSANRDTVDVAVLDGQTRPCFIQTALARRGLHHAQTVLDCSPDVGGVKFLL